MTASPEGTAAEARTYTGEDHGFRDESQRPWRPAGGYDTEGAEEKILFARDDGTYARVVRWPPGFTTGRAPLRHPGVDEFAWVIAGSSSSLATGEQSGAGSFCFVPAGVEHGPFHSAEGVTLLEFRMPTLARGHDAVNGD